MEEKMPKLIRAQIQEQIKGETTGEQPWTDKSRSEEIPDNDEWNEAVTKGKDDRDLRKNLQKNNTSTEKRTEQKESFNSDGERSESELGFQSSEKDSEDDWFLAKTWARNADAQVAQICNHLARTHFFLEPFALALHRCLAPVHPIFKMLKEHLRFIISINISIIISITTSSGSSSPSTPWAGRSSLHQGAAPMSVFPWVTVRRESRISWQRPSRRWSGTSLTTWAT